MTTFVDHHSLGEHSLLEVVFEHCGGEGFRGRSAIVMPHASPQSLNLQP